MSYNPTITATVTVTTGPSDVRYIARLDTDTAEATILSARAGEAQPLIRLGTGTWRNGRIDDCAAVLGDEVYEALDAALNDLV